MSSDNSQRRDELAVERTHLANERTLLAYGRTALGLMAAGAGLVRFFSGETSILVAGWILIASGTLLGLFGGMRFLSVRDRLRKQQQ